MINVYIEYGSATEHVATLQDEWVYMALLPSLEKMAQDNRGVLSESVFEDTDQKNKMELYSINTTAYPEEDMLLISDAPSELIEKALEQMVYEEKRGKAFYDHDEYMAKLRAELPQYTLIYILEPTSIIL